MSLVLKRRVPRRYFLLVTLVSLISLVGAATADASRITVYTNYAGHYCHLDGFANSQAVDLLNERVDFGVRANCNATQWSPGSYAGSSRLYDAFGNHVATTTRSGWVTCCKDYMFDGTYVGLNMQYQARGDITVHMLPQYGEYFPNNPDPSRCVIYNNNYSIYCTNLIDNA